MEVCLWDGVLDMMGDGIAILDTAFPLFVIILDATTKLTEGLPLYAVENRMEATEDVGYIFAESI
jgi:hypothetical protein